MYGLLVAVQVLQPAMQPAMSRVVGRPERCHVARSVMSATQTDTGSFVQTEMRKAAMALHSTDQAREGQQPAQRPVQEWSPSLQGYLQFLVDSREVYAAMERVVDTRDDLAQLRDTGLERTGPLDADISWFESEGLARPEPSERALEYAQVLEGMTTPAFICHFYNYYFAHTAGGRMIGKMLSDKLLDGRVLEFYKWDGDLKSMQLATREEIDRMAAGWTQEERDECLAETAPSFRGGGGLLTPLKS